MRCELTGVLPALTIGRMGAKGKPDVAAFRRRFEHMLKTCGLTRAEFVRATGTTQQNVNGWMHRARIGQASHGRVRNATGVSIEWLNDNVGEAFPRGPVIYNGGKAVEPAYTAPALRVIEGTKEPSPAFHNSLHSPDWNLLKVAVTAVAEGLSRAQLLLPPDKHFELIEAAYEMVAEAKDPEAMRPRVVRMVELTVVQGGK
jgi:hypothetical protein